MSIICSNKNRKNAQLDQVKAIIQQQRMMMVKQGETVVQRIGGCCVSEQTENEMEDKENTSSVGRKSHTSATVTWSNARIIFAACRLDLK